MLDPENAKVKNKIKKSIINLTESNIVDIFFSKNEEVNAKF